MSAAGRVESSSEKPRVAYLGPPCSYSHQITSENFDSQRYDLRPHDQIIDVFHAVQDKTVIYGVVPFENSSNGVVLQTLDAFSNAASQFPDIDVCGEAYLPVQHCLLGFSDSSNKDGAALGHVRKVLSHPQALGQCTKFLSAKLKGVSQKETASTSKAAEIASQDPERSTAAIASRLAADVFRLDILAEGIEDQPDNETHFLILRRRDAPIPELPGPSSSAPLPDQKWKTLASFTIDHNRPGALGEVLNTFAAFQLNLTSINSRPARTRPWHYTFFVEFGGRKEVADDEGASPVNRALVKLQEVTEWCRWHGSWVKRGGL